MREKKRVNKKILIPVLAVVLAAGAGVGGTLAILHARTASASNKFTHGYVNIEIEEDFEKQTEDLYTKEVIIRNDNSELNTVDTYIRAKLVYSWVEDDGNLYPIASDSLRSCVKLCGMTEGWIYDDEEDCYYYIEEVAPGDATTELMTSVEITDVSGLLPYDASGNRLGHLELSVLADGIQADLYESYEEAWEAAQSANQ